MELKGIEILGIFNALEKLSEKELDLSTSCDIARNIKELSVAKDVIENKRNKIVLEYAEKDNDGNVAQMEDGSIKIADMNTFSKKISELLESHTEVNLIKISMDSLSDVKISPKDIFPLIGTLLEE